MPKGGKGGCTMTFEQVVLLLTLLGGAIYVTFEITWTVSHSNDKKKNDRLESQSERSSFLD